MLIVNTKSRRGKEWASEAHDRLSDSELELVGSYKFSHAEQVLNQIKASVRERIPLIIVGGGDGSLSMASKEIVGSESVLGVLPLGTGNAFARDLGIPSQVEAACKILVEGKVDAVDLGKIRDRYFVNVATAGLTTRVAEELTDEAKRRLGRMVYAFALVRAVATAKPFLAKLTTDEGVFEHKTLQFVVGSGRFHGGPFPVTPTAQITDRLLNGYLLASGSKGALLKFALHLWGGRQVNLPEVHSFTTKKGKLETSPSVRLTIDGEVGGRTPFEFEIAPGALHVVVPQSFGLG